jgi:hypothetical protein
MIEMGMGEQQRVDRGGVEAERRGVLQFEVVRALKGAAVDQNALTRDLDEVTRTGNVAIGAVEGYFHVMLRA